jgi:hypothetical protein
MCQRPSRERKPETEDSVLEDPIWQMPEPPGALGDIVRRMKRHAALQHSIGLIADVRRGTA